MTSLARCFLQAASAFSSSGRSLRLPLSLDELVEQRPLAAVEVIAHGLALGVEAEAGLALLVGRDPIIGDELARACRAAGSMRKNILSVGLAVTVRRPLAVLKRGPRAPRIGDRVQIVFGPFAGHSGVCTKVSRQQVGVLLMIKAQRQVRLSRDAVELI